MKSDASALARTTPRPWKQAALWLVFLAPFFYLSYGVANHLAAQRAEVPSVVFDWEHGLPFLAWTIFPYWSINVFYGLSPFLCRSRSEVHAHGLRLLSAQVVAVTCFLLFPLAFRFGQPEAEGAVGWLFAALRGFDKPFNQAPSLHIALVAILWDLYRRVLARRWHWLLHLWALAIVVSVLTTYQHHFIDIPTGALLGWLCVWLWSLEGGGPLRAARAGLHAGAHAAQRGVRLRLGARYALGGMACFALAGMGAWCWANATGDAMRWLGASALWLCWPGVALGLVAANYLRVGPSGFQKSTTGAMSPAARWLLAPYLLAARLNAWAWTRGQAPAVRVNGRVWLGRQPDAAEARRQGLAALVDVSAELPSPQTPPLAVYCVPMLDLVPPTPAQLRAAADAIDAALAAHPGDAPVLVCCALGYSRSAASVAAWLLRSGHHADIDDAIAALRTHRPQLVLHAGHRAALTALLAEPLAHTA